MNTDIIKLMTMLGSRLKELRERKSLSQGQVAKYAELSQSTLSDLERGEIAPKTIDAVINLARYFDCSTDYLLGVSSDPSPLGKQRTPLTYEREIVALMAQLSDARRAELLEHSKVILEAQQRADNYREMAIYVERLNEVAGAEAMEVLKQMLDAVAAGDPTAAVLALDTYLGQAEAGAAVAYEEASKHEH